MHHRPLRRAAALSIGALLAFAGTAAADSVRADGDTVMPGFQGTVHLGTFPSSAEVTVQVGFVLICTGINHPDEGQTATLGFGSGSDPGLGGAILSVGEATIGPIPSSWADDGSGCPSPVPSLTGTRSAVTLRAPNVAGFYTYTIFFARSLDPVGNGDGSALGLTEPVVSFTLDVVANTPPNLTVPSDLTVEGDTTGGWTAAWSGVSATDPEDAPDPAPSCEPADGSVLPLGTTPVTCSVTDSGGLEATGGFDVTVVDTTDPVLGGMPAAQTMITDDPTGATIAFASPTATDIVDDAPAVVCLPASGHHVGTGTTTVTCTATDASGNSASDTFDVTVTYQAPHTSSATWLEPVAGPGHKYVANRGRTVPIKVSLFVDGLEVTSGSPIMSIKPCAGGTTIALPMTWSGGRWNVSLDTSMLDGSCYTVGASIDGLVAGSFTLDLRGAEATTTRGPKR